MNIPYVIIFLGALVLLSHLMSNFFSRIHVPNVLLLMLVGIIIGPVSGIIETADFGKTGPVFSNIVLLLILFESGVNLKLKELTKSLFSSFVLTVSIFIGTMFIIGTITHYILGLDRVAAFMTGAVLGGTSSAIVIPMIRQVRIQPGSHSLLLMESALSDVLCLITGLSLFLAMQSGIFEAKNILKDIGLNFLVSIFWGIASGLLWSFFIDKIRKIQNSIFITGAYLFIVYGITEYFGFNGGIAALMLGITLGNMDSSTSFLTKNFQLHTQPINDIEKRFFAEIVFVFATYFFVFIGVSMQFGSMGIYFLSFFLMLLLLAFRYLAVRVIIRSEEMKKDRLIIFSMAPKGLVPAILASLPLQAGLSGGKEIQEIVFAIIFLSIVFSSVLIFIQQRKRVPEEIKDDGNL